jgi:hypothetical protein
MAATLGMGMMGRARVAVPVAGTAWTGPTTAPAIATMVRVRPSPEASDY